MRKVIACIVIVCIFISPETYAQQGVRLFAYAGTGVSHFGGPGSVRSSDYYRNGVAFPNAVDTIANHFGRMMKPAFSAGLQLERPFSQEWSFIFSAQYESAGAHLKSDSLITPGPHYRIQGNYRTVYNFVSLNPQVQKTITQGDTKVSLHGGLDYAIRITLSDHFEYVDHNGINTSVAHSGGKPEVNDFRLTAGASFRFAKWNVDLNYKHGLSDYNKNGVSKAGMRIMELKLGYRLLGSGD